MTNIEYWTNIGRTQDVVLIKENNTGIVYAWTRGNGWHQPSNDDYTKWKNEILTNEPN